MKAIRLRIHFPSLIGKDIPNEVLIRTAGRNVSDVLDETYEKLHISRDRRVRYLKKNINVFSGQTILKNGKIIGRFTDDGYVPQDLKEQTIESGDEIDILFLVSAG